MSMFFIFDTMSDVTIRALVAARKRQQRAAIEYNRAVRECSTQVVIV